MTSSSPETTWHTPIKPAVNQIETHPYFQRDSLVKFCQKHGICITAHTPLGGSTANTEWFGSVSCVDDPVIKSLAEKYGKTPAQLVLRWGLQRSTMVIPKTSKAERLEENFAACTGVQTAAYTGAQTTRNIVNVEGVWS